MPFRTLLAVVITLVLAACGQDAASTGGAGTPAVPDPETILADARALPGIDDVTLRYRDPDGDEHPELPADPAEWAAWTVRLDVVNRAESGAGSAVETMDDLEQLWDRAAMAAATSTPGTIRTPFPLPQLEVWLHPVTPTGSEITVRAYPLPESRDAVGGPVGDAYLFAGTPGVVRAVFDGETADVRVGDASDLAKVADVAAVQGAGVDVVRTIDDSAELAVADAPPRPPYTPSADWPADPSAPECDPAGLRLEITGSDAALGSRYLFLGATNTGPAPCAVQGHPDLTFRTLAEEPLTVTAVPAPGAARVVIPPGARAMAVVEWNAMPTADNPDLTYEVVLAAAPGAPATELPLTSWAVEGYGPHTNLDIVDGGEVTVTEWRPDGAPF
ncbi:DUF4232 domain-containing protein [Jiangella alba]|uniref:DUF4232 domain-containing protein n=1 Tax=Jiangella alba TaxID=561176 RepID=A0A1H5LSX4_9ACTN|nr:DUF4232 domain-containing protein [Jiangella alba]SEE80084.1 Protein of unknown function [Jiangella alba]